ncbi:MAG: glycosyltransferase [Cycloclasticus sp.]
MSVSISIIVPVYNSEKFIVECLDSILAQDFDSFEVLVSDDGSADNTREILHQYAGQPNVRVFYQEKNLGITRNCNFLLDRAVGKYICFFAGDDVMLQGKLRKQFALMEEHPEYCLCYHPADVFESGTGKIILTTNQARSRAIKNAASVVEKMGIPASMSIMVRASMLPDDGFLEEFRYVSDWLMQIELAMVGDIGFVDEVLCRYRKYGNNNGKDVSSYEHEFLSMLEFVSAKYPVLSVCCGVGKARYLVGKSFRVDSPKERREILFESLKGKFGILNLSLFFVSCIPFSHSLFSLIYKNRYALKGSA